MNIFPVNGLKGELKVPGDKSISHRGLIISALAKGKSNISGFLAGEDCLSTLNCLKQLGVRVITKSATEIDVYGVGFNGFKEPLLPLNAGNSGTTARLLIGLLAGQNFFSIITGDSSLSQRPMERIINPLKKMGAAIIGRQNGNMLPLAINGQKLTGIEYELPVASAQLKSAILLAGLFADSPTLVKEPVKSRDHTERMLEYFGLKLEIYDQTIKIMPGQEFNSKNIIIPGDFSSAAFFIVGSLITSNSDLLIKDVGINPTRIGLIHVLQNLFHN
jgi:3-phosphoshikimate 1-carboxyvinyltransferase